MEDDPTVKMVSDPNAYHKACIDIVNMIRTENMKGVRNEKIAAICGTPETLVEEARKHAMFLISSFGTCRPTYVMFSMAGNGLVVPIVLDSIPDDDESRVRLSSPLSLTINIAPVDAYFFICETWMAPYDRTESDSNQRRPSERDDRKEAIIACCFTQHTSTYRLFDIERDGDGTVTKLTPMEIESGGNFSVGNMMMRNMFEDREKVMEFMDAQSDPEEKETVH
jgi:hypothetical protein